MRELSYDFHRRLDELPALSLLVSPELELSGYLHSLRALSNAHHPAEWAIEIYLAGTPRVFDFAPRRKADLLERDLADLGGDSQTPSAAESGGRAPTIDSRAALVGSLYVVEGSTLGGRVIARNVVRRLGLSGELGARFFHAYGDRVESRWREFVVFADSLLEDSEHEEAAHAAQRMFEWFRCAIETTE